MLTFLFTILFFNSCQNDDEPIVPTNETIDKGHEEWSKVTFSFRKGHLHGSQFHGDPESQAKYLKVKQEISFVTDEKGNVKMESEAPVRFIKDAFYALEITYYNKKGEMINGEFVTPQMAPLHQHFFLSKDVKDINTGASISNKNNLEYTYRDTNPWDRNIKENGVKLRLVNDPIGFKGYFKVIGQHQIFDLNVILIHVINGSKLSDNGIPYAFNNPSPRILGVQDLNLKLPVRIFSRHPETDLETENYIKDIAKEFNISYEEAEIDVQNSWDVDPESSSYYM
ncbi:hypothetical protein [Empedobacter brevis]|uniref:hypothetical protein n=1 Tax=Empedobacter brevis TaxID=247 RepID=UPI002FE3FE37